MSGELLKEPVEGEEDGACSKLNQCETKTNPSEQWDIRRGRSILESVDRLEDNDDDESLNQEISNLEIQCNRSTDNTIVTYPKTCTESINKEFPITPEKQNKPKVHALHLESDENEALAKNENDENEALAKKYTHQNKETFQSAGVSNFMDDHNAKVQPFSSDNASCDSGFDSDYSSSSKQEACGSLNTVAQEVPAENDDQRIYGENASRDESKQDDILNHYNVDDLCNDMIDEIIPKSVKDIKVIVLNVEDDKDLAQVLAVHLRNEYGCRAAPIEALKPLYHITGPQCLGAAQRWADMLMIIISSSWIRAIKNIQPTSNTDIQTARYHHKLIEAYYLESSCVNYTLFPVLKPGTNRSECSDIVELRDSHPLDYVLNNFEAIVDLSKWTKRGKELVENSMKKETKSKEFAKK